MDAIPTAFYIPFSCPPISRKIVPVEDFYFMVDNEAEELFKCYRNVAEYYQLRMTLYSTVYA